MKVVNVLRSAFWLGLVILPFYLLTEYDIIEKHIYGLYTKAYNTLEPLGIDISKKAAKQLVKENPVQDTFFLFALGVWFYRFKKYQQLWYGVVETLFAITYGYLQFTTIQKEASSGSVRFTVLLTILTVVYLTVRGVNNIDDGDKKEYWGKQHVHPIVESFKDALEGD